MAGAAPASGEAKTEVKEEQQQLPADVEEAQGTCKTPRQAWIQLLYWLQQGKRWDPEKACACFDRRGLPAGRAEELAVKLKKVLDARALWVPTDSLPTDPQLRNAEGLHRHLLYQEELGWIVLERHGDKWLFSASTLKRIPDLYSSVVPKAFERLLSSLPHWTQTDVVGVKVWQVGGVLLLILLALLLQRLTVLLLGTWLRGFMGKLNVRWLEATLRQIDRPVGGLLAALVFHLGLPLLQFPVRLSVIFSTAVKALAAFSAVWLLYRLVDVLTDWLQSKAGKTDTKLDDQLVPLVRKSLKVFVSVMGGIFILQNLNVDVASLLAGVGLGGLAFALAAKDTIANFFGSIMIFVDKPFQIGDWILIGKVEGSVEEVGFRTTRIRTFYNSLVTVPNSTITSSSVDNMGARRYQRYSTTLGLTYDTPPDKIEAFCQGVRDLITTLPGMRTDYFLVEFKSFSESALEIMLYCFMDTPDWNAEMRTRTRLNIEIMRLAEKLEVSFAYPTQTLFLQKEKGKGTTEES